MRLVPLCLLTAACDVDEGAPASVGRPCITEDENFPEFSGFTMAEINIERPSPACGDGAVCLVHHFQGRASCAAGQPEAGGGCRTPEGAAVEVPVAPQLSSRPADEAVICSCRCDAPFAGDYCACPSGMRCEALIVGTGDEASRDYEGAYCVFAGEPVEPWDLPASSFGTPRSGAWQPARRGVASRS